MKRSAAAFLLLTDCQPAAAPAVVPAAPLPAPIAAAPVEPPIVVGSLAAEAGSGAAEPCRWGVLWTRGGGGVVAPAVERMFVDVGQPLIGSVCRCAASDWPERIGVLVSIYNERGSAAIRSIDLTPRERETGSPVGEDNRAVRSAREAEAERCLAPLVSATTFVPWEGGSDVIDTRPSLHAWPAVASDPTPPEPVHHETVWTVGFVFVRE